jgi:hypothetical protein
MKDMEGRSKRRREMFAAVLGLVAVVLLWRAIWDMAAAIMSPLPSLLIVGPALVDAVAYPDRDYLRELF